MALLPASHHSSSWQPEAVAEAGHRWQQLPRSAALWGDASHEPSEVLRSLWEMSLGLLNRTDSLKKLVITALVNVPPRDKCVLHTVDFPVRESWWDHFI